jgi:hypothetical protein
LKWAEDLTGLEDVLEVPGFELPDGIALIITQI